MFTEVQVNTSMEEEFSQTMSGLVKNIIGEKEVGSKGSWKNAKYNLMKQLARNIVYQQTDKSMNGETKAELTKKTELRVHESVYTLIRKKRKKKKDCIKSQVLKQNTRSLHYSNVFQMIRNNTTKLIRNKLTLHENSRKIIKKRMYNREKSLGGKIQSMEKLLSSWKKDFKKKPILADLKWSMKSTFKSFVMQNEIIEQQITPVAIVPPLPLPMWAKALDEPPQMVSLRRTPGSSFMRTKMITRRRMRKASRKPRPCIASTDGLARALTSPRWTRCPRQVPVSTFQGTTIHHRFLSAKYGKVKLMGRNRVFPNSIQSNIHSNFSVINLLHEVEEAIAHNKYSKETEKMVKNFKDELNKDLLCNEPMNRKYHKYQIVNANYSSLRKKGKFTKLSSRITLSELVEQLGGNESEGSYHDVEYDREETCVVTGQPQNQNKNNRVINSQVDANSNGQLFRSFNNQVHINNVSNKLKSNTEEVEEVSKFSQNKKNFFKEKKYIKKKKVPMKEPKTETISEEERLSAILQELQNQVRASELPTHLLLAKNDSLTELNFETEPCTYLSMHASSTTIHSESQQSYSEFTNQQEAIPAELSEHEADQSLLSLPEQIPPIKSDEHLKTQHSSTRLYTFQIDYESLKNKSKGIYNIITVLGRINKLFQNIPIQYDKNTGRPYIVFDPKAIAKAINEVNEERESKMAVKKKKAKIYFGKDNSYCDTSACETNKTETVIQDEKGLEVENQLLKTISSSINPSYCNEYVGQIEDKKENNEDSQSIGPENSYCSCDQSLLDMTDSSTITNIIPSYQLVNTTHLLESPDRKIETIIYKKKYTEQVTKTAIANYMTGMYHQAIIYMERQEYFKIFQPKVSQKLQINQKRNEPNRTKLSNSTYAELKEKYMEDFRKCKNIPKEPSKKYGRHLPNETTNQTQANISQKYYHQYSKTRKLLLSKYELKRNAKKESVEKDLYEPCLKIDLGTSLDSNGSSNNGHSLSDFVNKPEHTLQVTDRLHTRNTDEKCHEFTKGAEVILCPKGEDVSNTNGLNRGVNCPHFNAFKPYNNTEQVLTNKNNLSIIRNNNSEGLSGYSINKSIMNSILRSVSINTIPNTCPIRKNLTKQVFYFQTTFPLIEDLKYIYKKQPTQEISKPSEHDMLTKYIYHKENSKLQALENDLNQQIMDSVNTIKIYLNKNISNICQIVNLDKKLLIKFLKICLKQNELDFKENKKLPILEKEMEELKLLMEKRLGKKPNPLRLIQRKHKRPDVRRHQEIIEFENNLNTKKSNLINKPNAQGININQVLKNNRMFTEILRILNVLMLIFSLISFLN